MAFIGELELEFCDETTSSCTKDDLVRAIHRQPRDARDWYLTVRRVGGAARNAQVIVRYPLDSRMRFAIALLSSISLRACARSSGVARSGLA
jgi:hypothetical protein